MEIPPDSVLPLLGSTDENLKTLERALAADIHVRGTTVTLSGRVSDVALAERVVGELLALVGRGQHLTPDAVRRSVDMMTDGAGESPAEVLSLDILSRRGKTIRPKTVNQKRYVDAIDAHTIVFGIGPAGTGKTYLAMAKAVQALQSKNVSRIILTRPAVEAGERLGFLPGTLHEKIDPYLRPLHDALHDMMDPEAIPKLMAAGVIEVAPLAYMRGRAQPLSTKVLTPTGFRRIGDVRVGDEVIGSDGRPTDVLGVYPQGFKDIVRVTAQDGSSTLCSTDHLWSVYTRGDRRRGEGPRVLEAKEMIGNLRDARHHRYELPVLTAPVTFADVPVPVDPYVLGLTIGDGCVAGVTATAFVPAEYLRNSAEVRLAVLQGLLDSAGGSVGQVGRTCRIRYATVSDRLRDDVVFLVQSLGGVAVCHTRDSDGHPVGRAGGPAVEHRHDPHVIEVRLPEGCAPFRLRGKSEKYSDAGWTAPRRYVESIESEGTEEAVCIRVAAADSLYVTEDFLLTHNTLNDAFIILDEAQNTTAEQMKMFLTRLGFGSKIVVTGDVTQVDLPGGQRSGLRAAAEILTDIDDIHFAELTSADVVRHRLVSDIVDAYDRHDAERNDAAGSGNRAERRSAARPPRR